MSQTGANFRRYYSIASINGFRRTVTPAVYEEDDIYHHRSFSVPFTLVGLYHNQFCTNEEINKSIDKYLLCNVNLPFPLFVLNILQYTDAAHSRSLKTLLGVCGKQNLSGGWPGFCCGGNPCYSKHLILLDIEGLISFEINRC